MLPIGRISALLACLTGLLLPGSAAEAQKKPKPVFLEARQNHLYLGSVPFRNVGVNIPDLFERFLRGEDASAVKSLSDAKAVGVKCVRCFGTTWGPDNFGLYQSDRARWFAAYDRMLAAADTAGILVVPSLLFNPHMLPDYVRKTTGKDEQIVDFLTPGSASNNLAVAYVTAVVSRYPNDPRIGFWEIGNEYNLEADLSAQWKARPANQIPTSDQIRAFLAQIATLIHRLDKHHLVTSGNAGMRSAAWHLRQAMLAHRSAPHPLDYPMDWTKDTFAQFTEMLAFFNPPPLDIISVHLYSPDDDPPFWIVEDNAHAFRLPWIRYATDSLGKPLFVGEFGQKVYTEGKEQISPWMQDFLLRMQTDGAPIGAIWSWEFDETNPDQSPFALSPQRTPKLVAGLAAVNQAILTDVLSPQHR